jgi:hypothetical protein
MLALSPQPLHEKIADTSLVFLASTDQKWYTPINQVDIAFGSIFYYQ